MNLLEVDAIDAGYGPQAVLRNMSITVEEGSFVGLVGPNGHGKTTLLRTLSGLLQPSRGEIRLANTQIDDVAALGRKCLRARQNGKGVFFADAIKCRDCLQHGEFPLAAR